MADLLMKTPVTLIIFKRVEQTEKVFETIRKVKPTKLLVIADGPRKNRPDEEEQCAATRAIIDRLDWDCQVLKNYSDSNMGCDPRIISGLNWVFEQVEETIILEDDCVPHPSFFPYCEELLDRYRHDQRIMNISGQNVQFGQHKTEYSYYFSRYTLCWGWATWKRAWNYFDVDLKLWPEIKNHNFLNTILTDPYAVKVWTQGLQLHYDGQLTGWDFKWMFACWIQNAFSVIPDTNLVTNIGHDQEATHTKDQQSPYNQMTAYPMSFPLKHPPFMIRDLDADKFTQRTLFNYDPPLIQKIQRKVKKLLSV